MMFLIVHMLVGYRQRLVPELSFVNQVQFLSLIQENQDEAPHPRQGLQLPPSHICPSHIFFSYV